MKVRRFDFNFKPLRIVVSFITVGSVPARQNYDAAEGEYTPDYSAINSALVIQPEIKAIDGDSIYQGASVNSRLANVVWYEVVDGGADTLITAENTNYEITTSGGNAGRIKVKRNVDVNTALTLRFYAEFQDPRTGQIHTIQDTFPVYCDNAMAGIPELFLDAAEQTLYNPLVAEDTQIVKASLKIGGNEVSAANRIFVWEKLREDNSWTVIGTDTSLDYDVTVAANGTYCTVNRSLMGTELYIRCRAKYDIYGNPSGVTLADGCPEKIVSFICRIPKFEYDIAGVPTNIPEIIKIAPTASIWDMNGPIANPERALMALWYVAKNKASGGLSYKQIGHGLNPVLPTEDMDQRYGAVLALDVVDCGPACAWEDGNGDLFEDEGGYILLI